MNSKATIFTPLDKLQKHAPMEVIDMIKSTPYFAASSNSIVIHSDEHREQRFNRQECFKKLTNVFRKAGENVIRGESARGPPKDLSVTTPIAMRACTYLGDLPVQNLPQAD